jgi:hypothetical protein
LFTLEPGTHTTVLDSSMVGAYGAGGVFAPEVVVDHNPDGPESLYRIWFLAQTATRSETTIAMAQGDAKSADALPAFVPYPANPILGGDEPFLGECTRDCRLLGLSATRDANSEAKLRLLVARRVQNSGPVEYQLVPLEQFWRVEWSTM